MQHTKRTDAPTTSAANEAGFARMPEHAGSLSRTDLYELRELLGTVWLGGYFPSPEANEIVAKANRAGSEFTVRLAIRALRLQQALMAAQERIIRMEWQLARAGKDAAAK